MSANIYAPKKRDAYKLAFAGGSGSFVIIKDILDSKKDSNTLTK